MSPHEAEPRGSYLVVLAGGFDAEVFVARLEIDFLVGADFLILVDCEIVGGDSLSSAGSFATTGAARRSGAAWT